MTRTPPALDDLAAAVVYAVSIALALQTPEARARIMAAMREGRHVTHIDPEAGRLTVTVDGEVIVDADLVTLPQRPDPRLS